ncbi:MAG: L-2-amino-thiazoline-4-carboxylic acid hydrolase [Deltaproteobacteria bacterium]|nr:L-2-amino-thiazoline-4-carboxylic acid hydrolase [Deltaproteobacteria bacterium]
MKVLFSLGFADIRETQDGMISMLKTLGVVEGMKTICYASSRHFAAMIRGEGCYPEKGKRRIWFKLHYLKQVYDYLRKRDVATADRRFEKIIKGPTLKFIGRVIPPSRKFTKDFMLHHVWPNLVANDYNIEGKALPPVGNSVSLDVRRCFLNEVARDVGLMPVADRLCHGDYIFWEHYHPNVRFSRTKTLINGDEYCDHTLTWVE